MNRKINTVYLLLIFFCLLMQCTLNSDNPPNAQLDMWVSRLCCQHDLTYLKLKGIKAFNNKIIEISFCKSMEPKGRIVVDLTIDDNKGGYKSLFDIYSEKWNDSNDVLLIVAGKAPLSFKGKIHSLDFYPDGHYRLYIKKEKKCGNISFDLDRGEMKNIEYLCVKKCM